MRDSAPSVLVYNESGAIVGLPIICTFSIAVAGGAGQTSNFLTSDGLTKGAGNTFLFNNVHNVFAGTNTIQTVAEAPVHAGWSYNIGTGQLINLFLESSTVVVAAQALEVEENGTVIKITVIGD